MTDEQRAEAYMNDLCNVHHNRMAAFEAFLAGMRAEREACAEVAEEYCDSARDLYHDTDRVICNTADGIAGLIRARGKDTP